MDIDLRGRVNNTNLPYSRSLLPMLEAVVNSLHAIEDAGEKKGRIDVMVERDTTQGTLPAEEEMVSQPIAGFRIVDNGVGFTDENLTSFNTCDTMYKESKGGKGIGRLLWLKAFSKAEIESVYAVEGGYRRRRFDFSLADNGVGNPMTEDATDSERKTTVRLVGFKPEYRERCPKAVTAIARRIVEHCLEWFIQTGCPNIWLRDEHEDTTIDLNRLFKKEMQLDASTKRFQVKGQQFRIRHLRLVSGLEPEHQLTFCANKRSVRTESLAKTVPNLEGPLSEPENGKQFIYAGYVSGKFLDDRVISERTRFDISDKPTDLQFPDDLSWSEIVGSAASEAQTFLEPYTAPVNEEKWQRIRAYVQDEAPQYRHLLRHQPAMIDRIPSGLPNEKLDLELYKINQEHDATLRVRYNELLAEKDGEARSQKQYRQEYERFLEEWNEAGMATLARHVAHRKATLAFLDARLRLQADGRYSLEEAVHQIIFPLKATSDDVRPENMNLWILDEKLSYHYYLASDKPLNQMGDVVQVDSQDRPDLLIFDRTFAFADSGPPFSAIVLIEFKRPARDDYSGKEGKSPIEQVYGYVEAIKAGKAMDRQGRPISVPDHIPSYAYIICDVTPTLKKQARYAQLTITPDSQGYFGYQRELGLYVEIISFDKLLSDAKKRNAILFEKLGLGRS